MAALWWPGGGVAISRQPVISHAAALSIRFRTSWSAASQFPRRFGIVNRQANPLAGINYARTNGANLNPWPSMPAVESIHQYLRCLRRPTSSGICDRCRPPLRRERTDACCETPTTISVIDIQPASASFHTVLTPRARRESTGGRQQPHPEGLCRHHKCQPRTVACFFDGSIVVHGDPHQQHLQLVGCRHQRGGQPGLRLHHRRRQRIRPTRSMAAPTARR